MSDLLSFDLAGLAAIILALISIINTIIDKKPEAKKKRLDILRQLQEMIDDAACKNAELLSTIMELRSEIYAIKGDMKLLATLCVEWTHGIDILQSQIKRAKGLPEWLHDTELLEKIKVKYGIDSG